MEATGHYWYPIYSFLKARGYTIYVINPIQSDSLRKMYIRQTKNDSIDSFLIAEVIRFGQFGTTSMADENILAMLFIIGVKYRNRHAFYIFKKGILVNN